MLFIKMINVKEEMPNIKKREKCRGEGHEKLELADARLARALLVVEGVIQGVGFRPLVYRLAVEEGLSGHVRNDGRGVTIEIQGTRAAVQSLQRRLPCELPPSSTITQLRVQQIDTRRWERGFRILASEPTDTRRFSLVPDRGVCADCLSEMRDPEDRRFRYAFINCTACGPRFTITRALPYDRATTTMATFPMCDSCRAEYDNPMGRRFHAEPIACPRCGPRVWLEFGSDQPKHNDRHDPAAAVKSARKRLLAGEIVAIKGIGGFHLAVDARKNAAVRRLRGQKIRERKPLAVMARDGETAAGLVDLDEQGLVELQSPAKPIVLAPARPDHGLSPEIAPGLGDLGVMLPYTPLHHLLLDEALDVLVMTSGNPASEPIATGNRQARELPADAWLMHDRDIEVANDDSVIRTTEVGPVFVRRSRGYVPGALDVSFLPEGVVLAVGAELKVTVSLAFGGELVVGRHLGNLDNPRAEHAFHQDVRRMIEFAALQPACVALDAHPDLTSTRYVEQEFASLPLVRVQHHHAHLCAVLAEHGFGPEVRATGLILDGLGWGTDGTIWGGEVLEGGYSHAIRRAHLRAIPQPGGDRAALEPDRMATSLLIDAGLGEEGQRGYDPAIAQVCGMRDFSPLTSSAGRLFDGAAALIGVAPRRQSYEGEAAMRLEAVADAGHRDAYPLPLQGDELDTRVLIEALVRDPSPAAIRAARFHNALAEGFAAAALAGNAEVVVLGGGCIVNRLLLTRLVTVLRTGGLDVRWPERLPSGDGGLSAGQAAIALCREQEGR